MKSIIVLLTLTSLVGLTTAGMLDGINKDIDGHWYVDTCVGIPSSGMLPHYKMNAKYSGKDGKQEVDWNIFLGKGQLDAQMKDDPDYSDCQKKKDAVDYIDKLFMRIALEVCKRVSKLELREQKLRVYMGSAYCDFTRKKPAGPDVYDMLRPSKWF